MGLHIEQTGVQEYTQIKIVLNSVTYRFVTSKYNKNIQKKIHFPVSPSCDEPFKIFEIKCITNFRFMLQNNSGMKNILEQ